MGRLVDSVMAALGLKPSDRVNLQSEDDGQLKNTSNDGDISTFKQTESIGSRLSDAMAHAMKETGAVGVESGKLSETQSNLETNESKKDCLSCKVISSTVLFGMAGYVLLMLKKNKLPPHLKRRHQRVAYITSSIFLSSVLILGGVARVFDLGIFSEDPTQELKDEVVWVYKFVGKEPPEFTKSKDKETENTS